MLPRIDAALAFNTKHGAENIPTPRRSRVLGAEAVPGKRRSMVDHSAAPHVYIPLLPPAGAPYAKAAPPEPHCCLLYTSPSPRDGLLSRMPSSA